VAGKGKDILKTAGGSVSEAYSKGARGGFAALSKGMKPLKDKAAGKEKTSPDWAKKVQRRQQTRSLGRSAQQALDNRLGSALVRGKNWRLAFFGQTMLSAILAGGFIWQGAQATVTPYVIEVDATGGVKAVGPVAERFMPSDAQIANQLAKFINNVRSVSIDPVVLRENWLEAYSYATDQASITLNAYAQDNDPFSEVGQRSVASTGQKTCPLNTLQKETPHESFTSTHDDDPYRFFIRANGLRKFARRNG